MPFLSHASTLGYFNVHDYGATGDGSTDDTVAIQAACDAAYAAGGGVVFFPRGRYKLTDTVACWGSISLIGVGRGSVLLGYGSSPNSDRQISINSGVPESINGGQLLLDPIFPGAASVIDRTAIGALAVGEFSLTLSDVSGMSVGQRVIVWLGADPTDITGPYLSMINTVKAIAGSVVTFVDPLPEPIDDPDDAVHNVTGVPTPRWHHCWTSPALVENVEVAHLCFERDMASGNEGYNALAVGYARNVHIHDIYSKDMGFATLITTYGENYLIENIYCDRSIYNAAFSSASGGFIGGWSMRGLTIRNVVAQDINGIALSYELQMRNVTIDGGRFSSTQTGTAFPVFINFNSKTTKGLTVRNCEFQSNATSFVGIAGYVPDVLENITVHKNCSIASLANASGAIRYEGVAVSRRKTWTKTFPIPTAAVTDQEIPLPSGWYCAIRLYFSTLDGVTDNTKIVANSGGGGSIYYETLEGHGGELVALTATDAGVNLVGLNRAGSGDFNNNASGDYEKSFYLTTDGTTPAWNYARIEIDYFPLGVELGSPAGPPGVDDLTEGLLQDMGLPSSMSNALGYFNVQDFGATGDGSTDDTADIMAAYNALPSGGVLYFPTGTYLLSGSGITLTKSYVTFRGAGMYLSTLKYGGAANLVQSSTLHRAVVIEDLAFDGASLASNLITLNHGNAESFIIRRCRFINFDIVTTARAITLYGLNGVRIEESLFQGNATGYGTAVAISGGIRDFTFTNNKVLYVDSGIEIDTGGTSSNDAEVSEFITIDHNLIDLGWWLIRERFASSGGTVTYSATVLTDTAAAFTGITALDNVRVMAVKQTGTVTFSNTQFTDASATFIANGVRRGDIVRSGGLFAVVKAVESETILTVEEWLDNVTRYPALYPSNGAYTIYGIVIGRVVSSTATTITVGRWHDFDGTTVTPSAGTRYEMLYSRPNYAIHAEYGVRHATIANNIIRRGWSDQISIFGQKVSITDNHIEDGQDMGITLHGQDNLVSGNRIVHHGAGGIYNTSDNTSIIGNYFSDTPWENSADDYLSHLIITTANNCMVIGNVAEKGTVTYGRYGFAVTDSGGAGDTNNNTFLGNQVSGHSVADFLVKGALSVGTRLTNNIGTILTESSTVLTAMASPAGSGGAEYVPSGKLTGSTTSTCTTAVTTEEDLWTYSLPAATLDANGKGVRITVFGTTAANANSKTQRLYFGSTALVGGATVAPGVSWRMVAEVTRTGASAEVASSWGFNGTEFMSPSVTTPAENTANAIVIKMTSQNGTAAAGDTCIKGALVEILQ